METHFSASDFFYFWNICPKLINFQEATYLSILILKLNLLLIYLSTVFFAQSQQRAFESIRFFKEGISTFLQLLGAPSELLIISIISQVIITERDEESTFLEALRA